MSDIHNIEIQSEIHPEELKRVFTDYFVNELNDAGAMVVVADLINEKCFKKVQGKEWFEEYIQHLIQVKESHYGK